MFNLLLTPLPDMVAFLPPPFFSNINNNNVLMFVRLAMAYN